MCEEQKSWIVHERARIRASVLHSEKEGKLATQVACGSCFQPYLQVCDRWKQFFEKTEAAFWSLVRTTFTWKSFGEMKLRRLKACKGGTAGIRFCDVTVTGQWSSPSGWRNASEQEGGVNTPDWADPMIIAIMTSRRKKRENAEKFRKWRRRSLSKQLFGASFSTHWSVKLCRFFVESCNYDLSLLRGKWNSEYSRKIMRKVYLKCFCPCPV